MRAVPTTLDPFTHFVSTPTIVSLDYHKIVTKSQSTHLLDDVSTSAYVFSYLFFPLIKLKNTGLIVFHWVSIGLYILTYVCFKVHMVFLNSAKSSWGFNPLTILCSKETTISAFLPSLFDRADDNTPPWWYPVSYLISMCLPHGISTSMGWGLEYIITSTWL